LEKRSVIHDDSSGVETGERRYRAGLKRELTSLVSEISERRLLTCAVR
jgi:hypothetical protein